MKQMWAPWRVEYIRMEKPKGCVLCEIPQQDNDVANYLLYRGELNYVMMNKYPYNGGHLMVVPYRHVARLDDLSDAEITEHYRLIQRSLKILREVFNPAGFNIGVNMGKVAGAGIEEHVHSHIVPRWQGDTNFMPVIGDVKVISEAMADTYDRLKEKFQS
jgi:ATP adenylyltransferase